MPIVSVVMQECNAAEFISIASDDLIARSFQEQVRVVINDGSTDYRLAVIEQYVTQHHLRSYHLIKNSGSCKIPGAKGIAKTITECIVSLDADDYFDLNLIERLTPRPKQTNVYV